MATIRHLLRSRPTPYIGHNETREGGGGASDARIIVRKISLAIRSVHGHAVISPPTRAFDNLSWV